MMHLVVYIGGKLKTHITLLVIENLDHYGVYVLDSDKDLHGWMGLVQEPNRKPDAWYTVICNGCSSFAIEYMLFDDHYDYPVSFTMRI